MTSQLTPAPLRPATGQTILLPDGARLTITGHVPADIAARRQHVRGAQLYFIGGLHVPGGGPVTSDVAGYLGKSAALYRASTSITYWCVVQRRLLPNGLALLHRDTPYPPDELSLLESRTIAALSTGPNVVMLNRHTSANLAGARLRRDQVKTVQDLADLIAEHLWRHVLHGRINRFDSPASNARERAVRIIRAADRALDTEDVVHRLAAAGYQPNANDPEFTCRRDLLQREDRGRPRIHTGWHRGRTRLYWSPALRKRDAITRYDQAKRRRTGPGTTRQAAA